MACSFPAALSCTPSLTGRWAVHPIITVPQKRTIKIKGIFLSLLNLCIKLLEIWIKSNINVEDIRMLSTKRRVIKIKSRGILEYSKYDNLKDLFYLCLLTDKHLTKISNIIKYTK